MTNPFITTTPLSRRPGLKTTSVMRRDNLNKLFTAFKQREQERFPGVPHRGALRTFAAHLVLPERYVGNLVRGQQCIGSATARKIEVTLGLPVGSMDQPTPPEGQPSLPLLASAPGNGPSVNEQQFLELSLQMYRSDPLEAQAALIRVLLDRSNSPAAVPRASAA